MRKISNILQEPWRGFLKELYAVIPSDRIYTDEMYRLAWGTDAGAYRLTPRIVVRSACEEEIVLLLQAASRRKISLTFRAAGTSLSGQAISDSVLVVVGKNWERYSLNADASLIKMQPGLTGGRIAEILKPYGKKFPPDPASIKSAMMGGIVMNNASGMSCGTHSNSDRTLVSARIILTDGTVLDTSDAASRYAFKQFHPVFLKKIKGIRKLIMEDPALCDHIARKYSIKNVMGLNLSPFLRYEDPFDIIAHLMTGSEGTLAFLAEATFRTEKIKPFRASAFVCFNTLREACMAVQALKTDRPTAVELLDRQAIRSIEHAKGVPSCLCSLGDNATALLIETQAESTMVLQKQIASLVKTLEAFTILNKYSFTDKEKEYKLLWDLRSGIFPAAGGMREPGSSCLIEDIAFPIDRIPDATTELQKLLVTHGYQDAVIYGHALEGNFHFILNQRFDTAQEVKRYESLIKEVVNLVVHRYDGSLKAEHGTGRNMAPFVKEEWGNKIWQIMKQLKHLFDPLGILNPGVIFNSDTDCYLKNLKPLPLTSPLIDKCIECGFCEVNCITSGLTLSARQRIVIAREISRIKLLPQESERLTTLRKQFRYAGEQTCAGDGLCATSCPMGIHTGELIHLLRAKRNEQNRLNQLAGNWSANHFKSLKTGIRGVLYAADLAHTLIGTRPMKALSGHLHLITHHAIPLWTPALPKPFKLNYSGRNISGQNNNKVVYFPSCINQTLGTSDKNEKPLVQTFCILLERAGFEVIFPLNMDSLCCGSIWESKGMLEIADRKSNELERALWKASEQGKYPIICDQSPCLYRMKQSFKQVKPYDTIEFLNQFVVDKLTIHKKKEIVAIHPTCSTRKMNLTDDLYQLASRCSKRVFLPEEIGCCGFAGDKGFTHPEVNSYALRKLKPQLEKREITEGYSNSRTCEIGLTTHTGITYKSVVYLLEECSQ